MILIWFFYDPSGMFQLPQLVWTLRPSVWDVFNNFLHIDATDRSKISSDQKRLFIAVSLYPLSFFANTPFKGSNCDRKSQLSKILTEPLNPRAIGIQYITIQYNCPQSKQILIEPCIGLEPWVISGLIFSLVYILN